MHISVQLNGTNKQDIADRIFTSVSIAEQGPNPALAVLPLSQRYSHQRLEPACALELVGLGSRAKCLLVMLGPRGLCRRLPISSEARRELQDTASIPILDTLLALDATRTLGTSFKQRIQLSVNESHKAFSYARFKGLIRLTRLALSQR